MKKKLQGTNRISNLKIPTDEQIHKTKYTRIPIKEHFHSICPAMELALAKICTEGDTHYGEWNWLNLHKVSLERFKKDTIKHLMRHLNLYRSGNRKEDHLAKVIWGCMAILHYDMNCHHKEGLK